MRCQCGKSVRFFVWLNTTWPGTTEELLEPRLRVMGFEPGENCALVFAPERQASGNPDFSTESIPKVIGGTTPTCLTLGLALYELAVESMVPVSDTKPFGFESYRLGLVELAGEVKCQMPHWAVQKVADALNEHGKSIKGSHMRVPGLAYKKSIDDTRESPAAEIISLLQDKVATVACSDRRIPSFPEKRAYHFDLKSVTLTVESVADYECTIRATDHDAFDYSVLKKYAAAIVDIRDRMRWESVVNA